MIHSLIFCHKESAQITHAIMKQFQCIFKMKGDIIMLTLYLVKCIGYSIVANIYASKIEKQIQKDLETFEEMTKDWK